MPTLRLRDDLGRELIFAAPPRRIVSLVPSDTHSLLALGAVDRLVGRTRYCDLPEVAHVAEIGGTKDVDVAAVLALEPDLVIGNQEENTRAALEQLVQRGARAFVSMPRRAADGIAHLARLARLLGVAAQPEVAALLRRGYQALPEASARPVGGGVGAAGDAVAGGGTGGAASAKPARNAGDAGDADLAAFVPIWLDPLMTCNADTFGSDVLARCGVRNVFADRLRLYPLAADLGKAEAAAAGSRDTRYPRVTFDEVRRRAPRLVLLPDEPHAFSAADEAAIAAELPGVPIARCSGRDLFWYGAWTIDALPRLRAQLAAFAPT